MVKVQAAAAADHAALAREIEERGRQAAARLARYERLAEALLDPDPAPTSARASRSPAHRVRARERELVRGRRRPAARERYAPACGACRSMMDPMSQPAGSVP